MPSKRGLGKNGLDVMFEPVKKVVKERQAGENVGDLAVKNFRKAALSNPLLSAKRGEPMKLLPESAVGELPRQRGSSRFLLSSVIMMTPL